MMVALKKDHQALAGFLLAFASMLRVFPILMVLYLLVEEKWSAIRWMVVSLIAIGLVTLAFVGWTTSLSFIGQVRFLTSRHWYNQTANISVVPFVSRIFWYTLGISPKPTLEGLRTVAGIAAETLLLIVTVRVAVSHAHVEKSFDARVFALWVVATIALAPTAWFHYLILLSIPFALIASGVYRYGEPTDGPGDNILLRDSLDSDPNTSHS
jgi:glycosyl transferase family 87